MRVASEAPTPVTLTSRVHHSFMLSSVYLSNCCWWSCLSDNLFPRHDVAVEHLAYQLRFFNLFPLIYKSHFNSNLKDKGKFVKYTLKTYTSYISKKFVYYCSQTFFWRYCHLISIMRKRDFRRKSSFLSFMICKRILYFFLQTAMIRTEFCFD